MLYCYSCQFSTSDVYDADTKDDWCSNNLQKTDPSQTIKPCAPWEPYCMTSVTTMLNSFASISRSCSDKCDDFCEGVGYGTDTITCTDCCENDKCNDNSSLSYYLKLMEKQRTSWTKPLPGELVFNKKNNLKFPTNMLGWSNGASKTKCKWSIFIVICCLFTDIVIESLLQDV
uniref:Toxin_TOLIP domain-containing protein n=1 Tax=Rhabditophanes sp. KR3021 TaxID=114890 RepID=A0AC35UBS9_9BILA